MRSPTRQLARVKGPLPTIFSGANQSWALPGFSMTQRGTGKKG
jgi:hypothetical protein